MNELGFDVKQSFIDFYFKLKTRPTREGTLRENLITNPTPKNFLEQIAISTDVNPFTKWWHYFSFYDEKLGKLAEKSRNGMLDTPVRILELGVWKGGSIDLWRKFFGPSAIIYGIDVNKPEGIIHSGKVKIGSQDDSEFLKSVVAEMGGLDVVIDDGSHVNRQVIKSFQILYPILSSGGLYFIEDLHTSYWPNYGGGLFRRGSSIEYAKKLIDYVNSEYFQKSLSLFDSKGIERPSSVEFADSIVLIQKGKPVHPELFIGGQET